MKSDSILALMQIFLSDPRKNHLPSGYCTLSPQSTGDSPALLHNCATSALFEKILRLLR